MKRLAGLLFLLAGGLLALLEWLLTRPARGCARLAASLLARAGLAVPDEPEPPVPPDV